MLSGLQIALQGVGFGPTPAALQGFVEVTIPAELVATGGGGGRRRLGYARELNELLERALKKPKPLVAVAAVVAREVRETSAAAVADALASLPTLRAIDNETRVVDTSIIRLAQQKLEKLREEAEEEEFVVSQLLLM
jgi:hypothetical protein